MEIHRRNSEKTENNTMKYHFDIVQNTPEWLALRLGRFTASTAADLLMDKKNEGYKKLIIRVLEERVTGKPSESKWVGNKFTERGHDLEPVAIEDFELRTFQKVRPIGFVEYSDYCGSSPDGLIGEEGLIQVKNPIFATQLEYLDTKEVPINYYKQMQFELFSTKRRYDIFYSYHPNLKPLKIVFERDEKMIAMIQERLEEANNEVINKILQIKKG